MAINHTSGSRVLASLMATFLGTATLTAVDVRSAAAQFDLGSGLRSLGGGQNAGRGGERARPGAATQRRGQPSSQAPRATRRGQQAAPEA
ncbi:MAG: hypothetical protein Q8O26_02365, partial [Phreatobacter sp.]|uniref:hypothetical protein n=1 Tax=Phreatobacter sp. TaxID=1966341 RepID=UPI0027335E9B